MAERLDSKRIAISGWDGWLFSRGTLRYKEQQWRPDIILVPIRSRTQQPAGIAIKATA